MGKVENGTAKAENHEPANMVQSGGRLKDIDCNV